MRREFDLSGGIVDSASTTEKALAWFEKKARPVSVTRFAPADIGLYEFTAMIVPLWSNDGLNTPLRYEGFVSVQGDKYVLEYGE